MLLVLPAAQPALHGQFSSGVSLVEVYATVTDRSGQPVVGLGAADFQVTEDDVPQTITAFAAGEFPLSVVIALDRSFSMAGARLARAKDAARGFIAALRPDDEVMVLAVGSEVETITPPVPAHVAAATRWGEIDAWGTTPLYDVTLRALDAIHVASAKLFGDRTAAQAFTFVSADMQQTKVADALGIKTRYVGS